MLFVIWFGFFVSNDFILISVISALNFVAFFLVINTFLNGVKGSYLANLLVLFFIYSSFFVSLNNFASLHYSGNYFVFSEIDAVYYHNNAIQIKNYGIINGFAEYLSKTHFENFGAVIVLSFLYTIVQSNLILNVFYVILSLLTVFLMYKLCRFYMSEKLSAICSFSFMASSYMIFFYSSGLKEPVMIFLVISFFYSVQTYKFYQSKIALLFLILLPFTLFLYRPVLTFFCFLAVGLGFVFENYKSKRSVLILIFVSFVIVLGVPLVDRAISRFMASGDIMRLYEYRMLTTGGGGSSLPFLFGTNIIAQYFGPLPTFSTLHSNVLTLYSSGLLFRMLISVPFWLGVMFIIKNKRKDLYPMLLFILFEMNALIMILDGYELRKGLPHIPLVYIIAFYALYHSNITRFFSGKRRQFTIILFLILIAIVFGWNLR